MYNCKSSEYRSRVSGVRAKEVKVQTELCTTGEFDNAISVTLTCAAAFIHTENARLCLRLRLSATVNNGVPGLHCRRWNAGAY